MVLTLYKMDPSPPARAAMMVIEYLQLKDVQYIDINLTKMENHSEAYLKLNPQHTVPTLKDDDFVVWDSHAIIVYLVSKYANETLYPNDLKKRAVINQRLHFDSSILFPAMGGLVVPVVYKGATAFSAEGLEAAQKAYDFSEKFLQKTWFAGDDFTIADICAMSTISSIDALVPVDGNKYPKLKAWLNRCSQLDIYKKVNAPGLAILAKAVKSRLA